MEALCSSFLYEVSNSRRSEVRFRVNNDEEACNGSLPLFCLLVEADVERLEVFFSFLVVVLVDCCSPPAFLSRPLLTISLII